MSDTANDRERPVRVRKIRIEVEPVFEQEPGDGELMPAGLIPDPLAMLRAALRRRMGV